MNDCNQMFLELEEVLRASRLEVGSIYVAARVCEDTLKTNKILVCGNGGSAADAQHFAAEFVGRYKRDRHPYPVLSLTTDTSAITALSNDLGFENVFSRQVQALGQRGDTLVAISTSGRSMNIIKAAFQAKDCGMNVIILTGKSGGEFWRNKLSFEHDALIAVPSDETPRIQECHMLFLHMIAELIEG